MRKNIWMYVTLALVVPGLLLTVSCAKKAVMSEVAVTQPASAPAPAPAPKAAMAADTGAAAGARAAQMAREQFESEHIYFDFDKADLKMEAQEVLKRKAVYLRNNSGFSVVIEGHCDERGTPEYNMALGDRRAESAKQFLVDLGIDAMRLTTISYGEERPLDMAANEDAWAKNRRAQFVVQ